jgi:hypothetical protein
MTRIRQFSHPWRRERGATLVIGMIMLVLLTLFVIAAVNMSTINLRVMGNTQARNESIAAAQQAIEQVVTTDFPKNPQAATITVDVTGDGTSDYSVAIAVPACLNSIPIKVTELDATDVVNDGPCFGSVASMTSGVVGSGGIGVGGNSYCSNTQWDVQATVTDQTGSNAAMGVHQGVARRVATGDVAC